MVAGQTAKGQEAPYCVTATQRPLGSGLSFAHTLFDVLTGAFPLINIACGHGCGARLVAQSVYLEFQNSFVRDLCLLLMKKGYGNNLFILSYHLQFLS